MPEDFIEFQRPYPRQQPDDFKGGDMNTAAAEPVARTCAIPSFSQDPLLLPVQSGKSIIIVGANGSGKTRLGVHLEAQLPAEAVQRIAAQKSLSLNSNISFLHFERAKELLRYGGFANIEDSRFHGRWGGNPAVHLLNDFDALQQILFAEQNATAVKHLKDRKTNLNAETPTTRLEELKDIWDDILSHRELMIWDTIKATPKDTPEVAYPGSEMSDGERAIFYFLGQCLVAPKDGIIIIDEPEIHIHKAILSRLWNAAESARSDCAFIYITHDLDFAANHVTSAKYFIRAYNVDPDHSGQWDIELLPEDTGLPEHVVAELVGSRRPILFVEGERTSLDLMIYRNVYREFTVVPVGSCENVIHCVCSYNNSNTLHRLGAAHGLIDADDRNAEEIAYLRGKSIFVLPVAQVENLLALLPIFMCLAELLYSERDASLANLQSEILCAAQRQIEGVCLRYTKKRLDRMLKRVSVAAKDISTLSSEFSAQLANVDPASAFNECKSKLDAAIAAKDLAGVLAFYDVKGHVLACVATRLGLAKSKDLSDKLSRLLGEKNSRLRNALIDVLPPIPV